MVQKADTAALERVSGMSWAQWCDTFAQEGGEALSHRDLARIAQEHLEAAGVDNPGWWAQGAAVAYEQHVGRRQPGQRADGTHEVSVSKTFGRDLDHALAVWSEVAGESAPFRGAAIAGEPSTSATEKWRYWRATLDDGTNVVMTIGSRPNGAAYGTVAVRGLPDADAAQQWRECWRGVLDAAAARAQAAG